SYWEFALKLSYALGFMTPKAGLVWSPNYFGFADDGIYASTGIAVPIPMGEAAAKWVGLTVDGNFGYTWTDDEKDTGGDQLFIENNGDTAEQYIDWNVGLVVAVHKNISVDLRYVDTNLNLRDGDARFVGGATFSF
ncbi:MAG TPA: TorF family putative porin, partial [Candidatus Binatia bacterium]|nr:TorF family putative porin [Candidatus Binatia bacterium]